MTTEITEILDRLHSCEAAIEVHRGYLKAMEYALRVPSHQACFSEGGSPPFSRTLTRRPIKAMRSVHVEAK
ncbi:hypothetical protein U5F73_17990, partial [Stenotrophomonas pavanii]|nr:hypothetical protein [Stenotrophomonas pavanii]